MIEYKYVYPSTDKYRMNERRKGMIGKNRKEYGRGRREELDQKEEE
jgi:hypothetical protein